MKTSLLLLTAGLFASSQAFAFGRSYVDFIPAPAECNIGASDNVRFSSPAREEAGFIDFSYASDPASAYALNNINSGYVYMAFQIPVADQTPYIGAKIEGVNFYTATDQSNTNPIKTYYAFVTDDLSAAPSNKVKVTVGSKAFNEVNATLETPFEITGEKPIYVGVYFKYVYGSYYMVCDQIPTPASMKTALVANVSKESEAPVFLNYSDQEVGSLCLAARITGDNLPVNMLKLQSVSFPDWVARDNALSCDMSVKNFGSNEINSMELKTVLADGTDYTYTHNFQPALGCSKSVSIKLKDIPNTGEGVFVQQFTVEKVNGEVVSDGSTVSGCYASYDGGFNRRIVIEEATGNWCGWCPRGIVMMEYLKENYPDWIRIAVHGGSNNEPMMVPDYQDWTYTYVSGFPGAIANRSMEVEVAGDSKSAYKPVNDRYTAYQAYVNVDVEAVSNENNIDVTSKVKFNFNTSVPHSLTYVIVEDNVGPYSQTNYYYGGKYGKMGGWENIKNGAKTEYDDVARAIKGYNGLPDAFPAQLEKDVEYEYNLSMPMTYTYGKQSNGKAGTIVNPFNARVVALVVNSLTGEIVNAAETSVNTSGVSAVNADQKAVSIFVEGNDIRVNGTDNFAVYTLDGRKVSANGVEAGVYVVKAEGKTVKVLVK